LLFGSSAFQGSETIVIQNPNLKIHREKVLQTILDTLGEEHFDIIFLKFIGAVEEEGIALDVDGFQLVKPSVDGCFRELAF
jgi:hypothetical protein